MNVKSHTKAINSQLLCRIQNNDHDGGNYNNLKVKYRYLYNCIQDDFL